MITFEVLIADLAEALEQPTAASILELEKTGKLSFFTRLKLASLEEQTAIVDFSEMAPRIRGWTVTGRGSTPSYTSMNVGTVVQITTRVLDDGSIVAQLYVSRSGLAGGPEGADADVSTPPKSVERMATQTTLKLKPGEAQILGGRQNTAGKDANKTYIVVTANAGAAPPTPAATK